jgi:hypothetical protein
LIKLARAGGLRVIVPATALAQAIRDPARQSRLSRLLGDPRVDIVPLDHRDARAVGRLLARTGTADIVDAHVVICAQRSGRSVLTSDAGDLRRLAPMLEFVAV